MAMKCDYKKKTKNFLLWYFSAGLIDWLIDDNEEYQVVLLSEWPLEHVF